MIRVLRYLALPIGVGIFFAMSNELHRSAEAAHEYQQKVDPYILETPSIWTRSSEEQSKFDIQIPFEEQMDIRMLQAKMEHRIDPDLARWLLILSMFLIMMGASWLPKKQRALRNDDKEHVETGDGE